MKKEKLDDLPEKVSEKDEFVALSSRYKSCNGNRFSIRKIVIDYGPEWKKRYERYANAVGFYDGKIEPGKYVQLYDKTLDEVVMSNTPMEFYTNYEFISKAKGDILVGGLGLGLLELSIQDMPEVNSITVVEYYSEIIKMISSQLKFRSNILIINEDILNFKTNKKFDMIYFDIWNTVSMQNYSNMRDLRMKFSSSLKESSSWMGCWREKECKMLYESVKKGR